MSHLTNTFEKSATVEARKQDVTNWTTASHRRYGNESSKTVVWQANSLHYQQLPVSFELTEGGANLNKLETSTFHELRLLQCHSQLTVSAASLKANAALEHSTSSGNSVTD